MTTLDDLITAIGKAEGWGVAQVGGKWQGVKYNAATTAPMGLLGDYKNHPNIGTDADALHSFAVYKLSDPRSATYVPGLVRADGTVNAALLPSLRNKWAPLGASNDPNGLNGNWLSNVTSYLGAGTVAAAPRSTPALSTPPKVGAPGTTPLPLAGGSSTTPAATGTGKPWATLAPDERAKYASNPVDAFLYKTLPGAFQPREYAESTTGVQTVQSDVQAVKDAAGSAFLTSPLVLNAAGAVVGLVLLFFGVLLLGFSFTTPEPPAKEQTA